jgi:DNA-binding response OmpR family regulator
MKTILIVDDESSIRNPLQEFLRLSTDCTVLAASDSDQALEHFSKRQIDLMVTNINMSYMNGIELTRYVRERYDTKVIIATAMDCYHDEAFDAGAIEYILKPLRFESFLKLINNTLLTKGNAALNGQIPPKIQKKISKDAELVDQDISYMNDKATLSGKDTKDGSRRQRMSDDKITYEVIISRVREKLSCSSDRISDIPASLRLSWWPYQPDIQDEVLSDYRQHEI